MDKKEIEQLKARLAEEYRKNSEAIDRVLKLLETKDSTPASQPESNRARQATSNGQPALVADDVDRRIARKANWQRKPSGARGAVVAIYKHLPVEYTKKDVERILNEKHPDSSSFTKEAVKLGVKALVGDGLAEVLREHSGRRPVLYRRTVE